MVPTLYAGEHLPPWLIGKMERDKEKKQEERQRIHVEIPVPRDKPQEEDEDKDRGVLDDVLNEDDSIVTQVLRGYNLNRTYKLWYVLS